MRATFSHIFVLVLLLMAGCTAPRFNDPALAGYNPNYPPVIRKVAIPSEYDGKSPVYACEEFAIFDAGKWNDPVKYYDLAASAARRGDIGAQGVLDQERKHSVKQICDDGLVVIKMWLFLGRGESLLFSEGNFRFYFADGSSALDRGVRVNMSDDRYDPHGPLRSYQNHPLKVSRDNIQSGDDAVAVVFLFDREHYGKEVSRVERIGAQN